jgi:hypothetical protein
LYAACKICVLVLSDNEETHMFPSSIYITMVVGDMFSSHWVDWCSLATMFCMCVRISAMYRDDAGPEIGEPCGNPFRTSLMLVQCPSWHMAAWRSDRKDFIHLAMGGVPVSFWSVVFYS